MHNDVWDYMEIAPDFIFVVAHMGKKIFLQFSARGSKKRVFNPLLLIFREPLRIDNAKIPYIPSTQGDKVC